MKGIQIFDDKSNYTEMYLYSKTDRYVDTNIHADKFNRIFENVKKKRYKCFRKTNMKTFNSKMEFIAEDANENVYEFDIIKSTKFAKNNNDFIWLQYKKKQIAAFSFPSNEKIHDIISNTRYTFKLNNLTYLNFEIYEEYACKITNEVFFNVIYANACDETIIKELISDAMMAF
jgi:hypothetical protein